MGMRWEMSKKLWENCRMKVESYGNAVGNEQEALGKLWDESRKL